jgi:hypothetical protein
MTPDDFTITLAAELRLSSVPYLFPEVAAFVSACWPLIADDPSPASWASRCAESRGLLTAVQQTG